MDIFLLVLRILLVVALYAFLGTVTLMLWRDLRQVSVEHETACPVGRLVIIETKEDEIAVGSTFPIQPVTSIGRSPSNTITIPDTYASAQHALLTWREGQWWLEDRNSRNGTLLNGASIDKPAIISAGDVIGVGNTRLRFEVEVKWR